MSPLSSESIGIKCGATSLSSNTSDEKQLPLPGLTPILEKSAEWRQPHTRPELAELQATENTLKLSVPDTDSRLTNNQPQSVENSDIKYGANLPKELIQSGEKLADELFQLLLVELSIDMPIMVNRHIHRANGKSKNIIIMLFRDGIALQGPSTRDQDRSLCN